MIKLRKTKKKQRRHQSHVVDFQTGVLSEIPRFWHFGSLKNDSLFAWQSINHWVHRNRLWNVMCDSNSNSTWLLHVYFWAWIALFSSLLIELSVSAVFYNRLSVIWNDSCFFLLFISFEAIITCCRVSHVAIRIHTLTWQLYRFHVYVFCLFLTASWIELRRLRLIIFFIQLLLLMFKHLRLPGVATYFFFYYSFSTFNVYK